MEPRDAKAVEAGEVEVAEEDELRVTQACCTVSYMANVLAI